MCSIFAGQDPEGFRRVNRSVRIAGHATSVQLETAFWTLIDDIAAGQDMSTAHFLSVLHEEAQAALGDVENFASILRTCCLLYLLPRPAAAPSPGPETA
ncbi:MAG: ribbon-helix-helix domain-containing protein [Rhizobiaceae bacterium]|nr:ribbon-helix-helix domain-containing protein [Rhizobiaceae bacterium]